MTKPLILTIERDANGDYLVLMLCEDGIQDVLYTCASEQEAEAIAMYHLECEARAAAAEGAERRYRDQYDHACGYLFN